MPGQKVPWIQESYNDYLILLTAEHPGGAAPGQAAQFTLPSNVAYLDALVYQQAFAPIESCGIAAQDGSPVNGPADYFTDITMSGYKSAQSYGWDPNETFGYAVQVTGGTPAPTNKLYFRSNTRRRRR